MIVAVEIAAQETSEMLLAHNDYMVEQFPSQCATFPKPTTIGDEVAVYIR